MLSDKIDWEIDEAIKTFKPEYAFKEINEFEKLIGMGELIDRLSIVNIKLFKLKDLQKTETDLKILADSCKKDVALCEERNRLKSCIDSKLLSIINKILNGDKAGGLNKEIKYYG